METEREDPRNARGQNAVKFCQASVTVFLWCVVRFVVYLCFCGSSCFGGMFVFCGMFAFVCRKRC